MDPITEKKLAKISKSPWAFFIHKRAISWLVIIATTIYGLVALSLLPREIQPEVKIPIGMVMSFLPGASAIDTESLLTEPLEKEIGGVSGIKKMSSTSGQGSSMIAIEFDTGTDTDKKIQEVKDAIDKVKNSLPTDAIAPTVLKAQANEIAIITYSLLGNLPVHELTKIAKDVQTNLEKVSGVSSVNLIGQQEDQVNVTLDQQKVEEYGLDIQTISTVIKYSNTNLPLGVVSLNKLNYSLRIDNRYQTLDDIRNLPISGTREKNSTTIYLKDIAKVEKGLPQAGVITKISIEGKKSLPAVSLQVYKKSGGNILDIADRTKLKIDELKQNGVIPKGLDVAVTNDNSEFIRTDLGVLTKSGIETTILIIIILFLALGFKQGLITGLSVPLTFLGTFIFMMFYGLSINSLSLFSMVIALGIAVDVSIVIMQGMHDNMKKGFNSHDAALLAIETYKWPLITGTLTTASAFFPMLLVQGIIGEFLKTLPIVISVTLFVALFLGLTVTPSLAARFISSDKVKNTTVPLETILDKMGALFHRFIITVIGKKSVRVTTFCVILTLFLGSMSMPILGIVKTELFPQTNQNYFVIDIEAPTGTIVEDTAKIVEKIEASLDKVPEIRNFLVIIGSSQSVALAGNNTLLGGSASESSNLANITVNLIDKEERKITSYEIATSVEKDLRDIKEAKITVQQAKEGPPSDAPVNVKITGKDLVKLKEIANQVKDLIKKIPGTKDIETSLKSGLNEFQFTLDRDALAYHGLSSIQVAALIRNILQGANPTTIKIDSEDTNIIVQYNLPKQNNRTNLSFHDIENFQIPSPKGYMVSLSQLGTYTFGESANSIERENQKRVIKVASQIEKTANSVEITKQLQKEISKLKIPADYEIGFGGDFADIQESFNDLYKSLFVGLILITFFLVLQYNSFTQTFIHIFTLPMGIIGVFPGLWLIGLNMSFPALLGIIALTGIVVNHAIVLIDRINENRRNGIRLSEAIAEATYSRFNPIFMTTITAIIGILPLALTNEFWAGLGFSLLFGLAFSTLLTLVALPIVYYTFEEKKARKLGEKL
ncbi:MAG: efflux RND transporter permease subunit [Candidatus Gracilibacteria bacterium]|jgi:HAE1 family hydrophobic/amphiphilic exporter-1